MAQRAIREYDAKVLLQKNLEKYSKGKLKYPGKAVLITPETDIDNLVKDNPWLVKGKLVVKPDELFGKRGKNKLLLVDADFKAAGMWIAERMGKEAVVHREFDGAGKATDAGIKGKLSHFIVEPMTPHRFEKEYYLALSGHRDGDHILFSTAGGVDIEENKDKLITIDVPTGSDADKFDFNTPLGKQLKGNELASMTEFVRSCFKLYVDLHFGFLEFNPLVIAGDDVLPLDVKARLDNTASIVCAKAWGGINFPVSFGRELASEERYIEELDEKSGASMKLTILNPHGRVWMMVAGGGASVIYTDTVVDLGFGDELANYGEYSGDPTTDETREYAKTMLALMTREESPGGKIFIIGGGIANFTDVAKTFDGIIQALTEYAPKIREKDIRIYVRRGGPNYIIGLAKIKEAAEKLGLQMEVNGPEMHMTAVVRKSLDTLRTVS